MKLIVTSVVVVLLAVGGGLVVRSASQEHGGHAPKQQPQDPHAGHRQGPEIPGYVEVPATIDRVQKFGVRTQKAVKESLTRVVRTVGIVRTDETLESHVHTKWNGWIEEFFVSYVGQAVKEGDPLFSVYSPELLTAQEELLIALRRARSRPDESAQEALAAARTRLRLWDVPEATVAELEKTGKSARAVTLRAPRDGIVVSKMAIPGMYVEPSMQLYMIADLSRVWVLADLYEFEMPLIATGQSARFIPIGGTGEEYQAKVVFVPPTVAPMTRTVKARLEIPNSGLRLRPGAYGTVLIDIPVPPAVTIPTDAVIDTGIRQIAFVHAGEGVFEPRAVRLGMRAGDRVQVLEGIKEGEQIVTRGQFMLDSESRLRAAAASGGKAGHSGH